MRPSKIGIKQEIHEGAQGAHNTPFRFNHKLTLSQHPREHRKGLFIQKYRNIVMAKALHPTDFQGYTIRERFVKMGWGQLLNLNCDKIYRRVVIQWMSTLSKDGDELTGKVDGKSYTITPVIIRNLLGVDTRTDLPYARFNKEEFQANTDENKRRWIDARKIVFGLNEDSNAGLGEFHKSKMTPLVKILWQIGVWTFYPRLGDIDCDFLRTHEIYLLHALFTGDYLYRFAHLMIDDIWDMYEHEYRKIIPHGYYISEILSHLGAVHENESVETVPLPYRSLSKKSFPDLEFSESPTTYLVADRVLGQRVVLQKEVIEGKSLLQPPHHQMPGPSPHPDMTNLLTNLENLTIKQFSQSQEKHNEMISIISNMVKQMEHQTLEGERREQERLKQTEERDQERERRAEEREQERERRAEGREKERERRAEEREQERERRAEERERNAEIRAHAIIWDIERQRYLYEQEQQQLRMTWNQVNAVNTADGFQFPQISDTSFHPPQAGSRYHDPTRSYEIPKAFQSLYYDIYGPRH
uniref:uncharacterized protein LOC122605871 n=1 Tax=Erigeron canadensis TaxID=72917 RepID=UPI001CB9ACB3|nr:uncharacterized protein LOC122605871 [Erigeron canadensis]XP_043634767.1 uncharacterized protein LOC122605871 [Erigeron canadensis]